MTGKFIRTERESERGREIGEKNFLHCTVTSPTLITRAIYRWINIRDKTDNKILHRD